MLAQGLIMHIELTVLRLVFTSIKRILVQKGECFLLLVINNSYQLSWNPGDSGYCKIGKIMFQWSSYSAKANTTFSFPYSFSSTVYLCIACPAGSTLAESVYINKFPRSLTPYGFSITKASDNFNMNYLAIGI